MATSKQRAAETVELKSIDIRKFEMTLVGDSPLICHRWSEKAKREILDKHMKKARQAKIAKDPDKDFEESLYKLSDGGYGFPAIGVKAAAVSAARHATGLPMTFLRGAFHIDGEMVRIHGSPRMREDMVRVGIGGAENRFRGEFREWSTTFVVRYNASTISIEQIINLFNIAGFAVGIGEWRPEKDGSYGMFHVAIGDGE